MDERDDPLVTIVMAPRELYSREPATIRRLLTTAHPPFELVVVHEARCPFRVERAVRRLAARHGFRHLHLPRPAGANACRMAGVATVDTPYTLFLDNDAELASGALAALLRCAELTDASFVATLCLNRDRTLHYSGGRARLVDGALLEERPYGRLPAAEVLPHLKRSPTDAPELHGVLVHTQRLADAGGLDPELSSSMDCIDLGLRLNHVAGGGWLEPEAALTYHRYAPGPTDLRIYLDRWSRATIDHDIEHFARTWQVDLQCEGLEPHRESLGERRWRPFRYLRGGIRRALGDRAVARLDRLLDPQIDRLSTVHRQGGVPW